MTTDYHTESRQTNATHKLELALTDYIKAHGVHRPISTQLTDDDLVQYSIEVINSFLRIDQ